MTEPAEKSELPSDETLAAFAKGHLDEATEDRIAQLLADLPELQAKVAAISIAPVVDKMRRHSVVLGSSQRGRDLSETVVSGQTQGDDLPSRLEGLQEYRILRELGRGGMGVVYLAENTLMKRQEVLKVLNERLLHNEEARERFQQEINVTAQLDHPSIVSCHGVRKSKSTVVFVLEYVEGKNLASFITKHRSLPVHVACRIAIDICDGLQHAMQKGVVHRDIKPSNIMLYKDDRKRTRAKILDFGLGRVDGRPDAPGLTEEGALLGTMEYIAPEQSMDAASVDIRADIYSLGCTLYHMLVGHPPFSGSYAELIMAHAQTVPPAVNLIQPTVPRRLGEVVRQMLEKMPDQRIGTPRDVAGALRPFTRSKAKSEGEKPAPLPETHGPWAQALQDTSVGGALVPLAPEPPPAQPATINESPAINVVAQTREPVSTQRKPRGGFPKWAFVAVGVLLFAVVAGLLASQSLRVRTGNGTIVFEGLPTDADVLVDGERVDVSWDDGKASIRASAKEHEVIVRRDGTEVQGRKVKVIENDAVTFAVQYEANADLSPKSEPKVENEVKARSITVRSANPVDAGSAQVSRELEFDGRWVQRLNFANDDQYLAVAIGDVAERGPEKFAAWNYAVAIHDLKGQKEPVVVKTEWSASGLTTDPSGQYLGFITGYGWSRDIHLLELGTGEERASFRLGDSTGGIFSLALSSQENATTIRHDGYVHRWDWATEQQLPQAEMQYPQSKVHRLLGGDAGCFSLDQQRVFLSTDTGTIYCCELSSGQRLQTLVGHSGSARIAADRTGERLVSACDSDKSIVVWDVDSAAKLLQVRLPDEERLRAPAISRDGRYLCLGFAAGRMQLWDVETATKLLDKETHEGEITRIAFAGDGRFATAGADKKIRLWSTVSVTDAQYEDHPGQSAAPESEDPLLPAGIAASDWIQVFDDGDLSADTTQVGSEATPIEVVDGVLRADGGNDRMLLTTSELRNFRARIEYKAAGGEAALIFRCPNPTDDQPAAGYGIGLAGGRQHYPLKIDGGGFQQECLCHHVFGSNMTYPISATEASLSKSDSWRSMEVIAIGDWFAIWLDGKLIHCLPDQRHDSGALGS